MAKAYHRRVAEALGLSIGQRPCLPGYALNTRDGRLVTTFNSEYELKAFLLGVTYGLQRALPLFGDETKALLDEMEKG